MTRMVVALALFLSSLLSATFVGAQEQEGTSTFITSFEF